MHFQAWAKSASLEKHGVSQRPSLKLWKQEKVLRIKREAFHTLRALFLQMQSSQPNQCIAWERDAALEEPSWLAAVHFHCQNLRGHNDTQIHSDNRSCVKSASLHLPGHQQKLSGHSRASNLCTNSFPAECLIYKVNELVMQKLANAQDFEMARLHTSVDPKQFVYRSI